MAVTINNKTSFDSVEFLQEPFVVTLSSNQTGSAKFRFILDVYINTTSPASGSSTGRVIQIKQQPNENNIANIDISKVLRSYVKSRFVDGSDNPVHETSNAVNGGETLAYVYLNGYEEYAAASDEDPIVRTANNDTQDFFITNSVHQFTEGLFPSTTSYQVTSSSSPSVNLLPLTDAPTTQTIATDEYATMAYYNTDLDSQTPDFKIQVKYYDSAGSQLGSTQNIDVVSDLSGDAIITSVANGSEDSALLFLPVGYANLEGLSTSSQRPSSAGGTVASYTVQINDGGSLGFTLYTFNVVDRCRFTPRRIAFLNRYGVWDYYTFELKSQEKLTGINRKTIRKPYGTWSGSSYSYLQHERGLDVFDIEADVEWTLRSDWLEDNEFVWLKQLLMSKEVFMYLDDIWQPVVITSNSYDIKRTQVTKLSNLEISCKLAHKYR